MFLVTNNEHDIAIISFLEQFARDFPTCTLHAKYDDNFLGGRESQTKHLKRKTD